MSGGILDEFLYPHPPELANRTILAEFFDDQQCIIDLMAEGLSPDDAEKAWAWWKSCLVDRVFVPSEPFTQH